jgi:Leucine-rich repeat (LRR) protein
LFRYLIVIDDIWSVSCWDIIRCALPDNKHGYRIITTTRSLDVANKVGGPYKMRSLSQGDSRKLLSNIISGSKYKDNNEDTQKYPDELFEVSHKFLEKCDGVPLAIITIASLLASEQRNKMEWYELYNSFGTGLDNNTDLNKMRTFFLLSYHNIPSHLRTCLLYLDVFPKDHEIDKARLIWMWIAEGFIQCEEQGRSLFEIGERYFDELLNRHMIQPVYSYGMIEHCRVHDMVFDLIHSLSSEENFVTVLSDEYLTSGVQRLSLQTSKEDHTVIQATRSIMEQVRSAIVFPSAADRMPALGSLRDLCVLDLNDCDLSRGYSLKYLGSLFFLRYLGLSNTRIAQLPEEVGNLQVLQTLSVTCNKIGSLPLTVVRLRNLMCLRIDMDTRVPNGIASLTSLEELSRIGIYDSTDIEMLCYLQELRVLDISCHIECMDNLEKSLVDCLSKLKKVQNLSIWIASGECKLDALVVPQHLCRLSLHSCWLSTLPAWVNPSSLMNLSFISIAVTELKEEDLESLGRLPALCSLNLKVDHENHLGIMRRFFIGAGLFQCLLSCVLWGLRGPVIYRQGAMPRLTSLRFTLHVRDMREIPGSSDAGYNLGLENLLVLQDVTVLLRCGGASDEEVEEVKVALRHATKIHPNHPTIKLIGYEDKGVLPPVVVD